jgi:hypothetical protein
VALPNPTLTWEMTALFPLAAATNTAFIDAVEAAVNALPAGARKWTVSSPTGDVAGVTEATLLTPPATSPINGTITCLVGVETATLPAAAEHLDSNVPVSLRPCCSIGGAYAAGNNWTAANPYGAGIRYIEMAGWCPAIAAGPAPSDVFVIASEESIFIGARVNDTNWYGTLMGAIFEPPDVDSAEADERIYGFLSSGSAASYRVFDPISGTSAETWNRNNVNATRSKGAYFDPLNPTTTQRCAVDRRDNEGAIEVGTGTSAAGNPFFRAIYCRDFTTPFRPIGRLRGVYFYEDALMRAILTDSGANQRGFCVSSSISSTVEAVAFGNVNAP